MRSAHIGNEEHQEAFSQAAYREEDFPALGLTRSSRALKRLGRVLLVLLLFGVLAMFFAPWQQSIRGEGAVIAFDPFERTQEVQAPVKGRIAHRGEGVQENAYIEKGQLLFEIQDQDPYLLDRLKSQVDTAEEELRFAKLRLDQAEETLNNNERIVTATRQQLESTRFARDELMVAYDYFVKQAENKLKAEKGKLIGARAMVSMASADFVRKDDLFKEGIESELKQQMSEQKHQEALAKEEVVLQDIENAENGVFGKMRERASARQKWAADINKIESELEKAQADVLKTNMVINKTREEINQKQIKLTEHKSKLAKQQTQKVRAPLSGYIMNLAVFAESSIVKESQVLCRIVPKATKPAVQVWVSGNDAPLIAPGRHVRLQFEGWPAVQFSGWPSVAVGTFGGTVALVDPTDNGKGKFRVVITPDDSDHAWPEYPYLRQGVRSNSWVLLDQVSLGYEIWRRMNGFPPALQSIEDQKIVKPPTVKL